MASEKSNLRLHAERELDAIGETGDMREHLLRMVDAFSEEGHSGFSASHAANVLHKLFRFEPLAPLSGDDREWMEVSDGVWQNVRCSHVFKDTERGAYDIQGRVFREPNGACYTNGKSRTPVTFPYTPKTEYVDVTEDGEPLPAVAAAVERWRVEEVLRECVHEWNRAPSGVNDWGWREREAAYSKAIDRIATLFTPPASEGREDV